MEHPWLPMSIYKKGLKTKKTCFISTLTAVNERDISAEQKLLMTPDLNSNVKDKFKDFKNL